MQVFRAGPPAPQIKDKVGRLDEGDVVRRVVQLGRQAVRVMWIGDCEREKKRYRKCATTDMRRVALSRQNNSEIRS